MDISTWFLWFILYSFVGWVYESILCSFLEKKPVNRGFLNGPICPIYGAGAVLIIFLLSRFQDNIPLLFLLSAVMTTTLEYLTSWTMEKLFHARWWDYSDRFLNINGRVCLIGFVAFGTMAVLILDFVHPWVTRLTGWLDPGQRLVLAVALGAFMALDLTLTLITVLKLGERLPKIQAEIAKRFGELTPKIESIVPRFEEIAPKLESLAALGKSGLHAFQLRRLSKAFPKLQFPEYRESWQRVKKYLLEKLDERKP